MKLGFGRPKVDTHDQYYAKAHGRLARMSIDEIHNYVEVHLSGSYMAFDEYRSQPSPITLDEIRKNLSIVRAAVDILDDRAA